MRYNTETVDEFDVTDLSVLDDVQASDSVWWIDLQGMGDEQVLRSVAERFAIHPLALEDVVHGSSRSKAEAYDDHLLVITRMARLQGSLGFETEQLGLFIGSNYLLSFQEQYGDILDPIRSRIRATKGSLRRSGTDYLAYAIFDVLIDAYFPIVDTLGEELETIEELVMTQPDRETLSRLNNVRGSLLALRRTVNPQRETVNRMIRDASPFVGEETRVYLRDVYDHCIQINEGIEIAREIASGLLNTYLSVLSNRTNEVMKVLTIVASIFVPLTFMAGIYGMNFEHMPELKTHWGYPVLLIAMAVVALGMLLYFWRKGWIGSKDGPEGGI